MRLAPSVNMRAFLGIVLFLAIALVVVATFIYFGACETPAPPVTQGGPLIGFSPPPSSAPPRGVDRITLANSSKDCSALDRLPDCRADGLRARSGGSSRRNVPDSSTRLETVPPLRFRRATRLQSAISATIAHIAGMPTNNSHWFGVIVSLFAAWHVSRRVFH